MKRRFSLILAVLLTLSLLAGCGGNDAPETTAPVTTLETTAPADAVGLTDTGRIQAGKKADVVVLDRELNLTAVFVDGERQV